MKCKLSSLLSFLNSFILQPVTQWIYFRLILRKHKSDETSGQQNKNKTKKFSWLVHLRSSLWMALGPERKLGLVLETQPLPGPALLPALVCFRLTTRRGPPGGKNTWETTRTGLWLLPTDTPTAFPWKTTWSRGSSGRIEVEESWSSKPRRLIVSTISVVPDAR